MERRDLALVELGRALKSAGYRFTTVTPETHARVLRREPRSARTLCDVFGWNRAFARETLSPELLTLADRAGVLAPEGAQLRSTVRFSSLGDLLLAHSAFPTNDADSVFFGPDTYRFCAFVARHLDGRARLVDVGCGTGAGALVASARARRVVLSDINEAALRFARINAELAGVPVEVVKSDVLAGVVGHMDAVIANPPYLLDASKRVYRDGGGEVGEALALRIAREAIGRLPPGGVLLLYTGAPILDGVDVVHRQLEAVCRESGASLSYEELDPDVFGSELDEPAYSRVERIAAIGAVVTTKGRRGD